MKILAAALLAVAVVGCSSDPSSPDYEYPQFKSGKEAYEHHCASCHGNEGLGKFLQGIPSLAETGFTYTGIMNYAVEVDHVERPGRAEEMPRFVEMDKRTAGQIAVYIRRTLRTK